MTDQTTAGRPAPGSRVHDRRGSRLHPRPPLALLVGGLVLVLGQVLAQALGVTGAAAVDPAASLRVAAPAPAPQLRPNLVVLQARDLSVQRSGTERWLRFESALGNKGRGPLEVRPNRARPCPAGKHHATQVIYRDVDGGGRFGRSVDTRVSRRSAGCMVFHRSHDHWHLESASRYTLLRAEEAGGARVRQRKMSFCLRDSRPLPETYRTPTYPRYYGACSQYSPQGISIGWTDVYQSFLPGQAVRLPAGTRDGLYCLHIEVDPLDMLRESREDDNTSVRQFMLTGDAVTYTRGNRTCRDLTTR